MIEARTVEKLSTRPGRDWRSYQGLARRLDLATQDIKKIVWSKCTGDKGTHRQEKSNEKLAFKGAKFIQSSDLIRIGVSNLLDCSTVRSRF